MLTLDRCDTTILLAEVFRSVARPDVEIPADRDEFDEAVELLEYLDGGNRKHGFGARFDYQPEFTFEPNPESRVKQVRLLVSGSRGCYLTIVTRDGQSYLWCAGFGKRVDDATTAFLGNLLFDWLNRLLAACRGAPLPRAA